MISKLKSAAIAAFFCASVARIASAQALPAAHPAEILSQVPDSIMLQFMDDTFPSPTSADASTQNFVTSQFSQLTAQLRNAYPNAFKNSQLQAFKDYGAIHQFIRNVGIMDAVYRRLELNQTGLPPGFDQKAFIQNRVNFAVAAVAAEFPELTSQQILVNIGYPTYYSLVVLSDVNGFQGDDDAAFAPTRALRLLQLAQIINAGVVEVSGDYTSDNTAYFHSPLIMPRSFESSWQLWEAYGNLSGELLRQRQLKNDGLQCSSSDFLFVVPGVAFSKLVFPAAATFKQIALKATGELVSNVSWTVGLEAAAEIHPVAPVGIMAFALGRGGYRAYRNNKLTQLRTPVSGGRTPTYSQTNYPPPPTQPFGPIAMPAFDQATMAAQEKALQVALETAATLYREGNVTMGMVVIENAATQIEKSGKSYFRMAFHDVAVDMDDILGQAQAVKAVQNVDDFIDDAIFQKIVKPAFSARLDPLATGVKPVAIDFQRMTLQIFPGDIALPSAVVTRNGQTLHWRTMSAAQTAQNADVLRYQFKMYFEETAHMRQTMRQKLRLTTYVSEYFNNAVSARNYQKAIKLSNGSIPEEALFEGDVFAYMAEQLGPIPNPLVNSYPVWRTPLKAYLPIRNPTAPVQIQMLPPGN